MKNLSNTESNQVFNNTLPSATQLLKKAFSLYGSKFGIFFTVLLVAFVFQLPTALLIGKVSGYLFILFVILTSLVNLFSGLALVLIIVEKEEPIRGIADAYKKASKYFISFLWIFFLVFLSFIGGFVLLVIPGLLLTIALGFSFFILVIEEKKGMEAITTSWHYVKGFWLPLIWRFIFFTLIVLILPSILLSLLRSATFLYSLNELFGGLSIFQINQIINLVYSNFIFLPISFCFQYILYTNLRRLKTESITVEFVKKIKKALAVFIIFGVIGLSAIIVFYVRYYPQLIIVSKLDFSTPCKAAKLQAMGSYVDDSLNCFADNAESELGLETRNKQLGSCMGSTQEKFVTSLARMTLAGCVKGNDGKNMTTKSYSFVLDSMNKLRKQGSNASGCPAMKMRAVGSYTSELMNLYAINLEINGNQVNNTQLIKDINSAKAVFKEDFYAAEATPFLCYMKVSFTELDLWVRNFVSERIRSVESDPTVIKQAEAIPDTEIPPEPKVRDKMFDTLIEFEKQFQTTVYEFYVSKLPQYEPVFALLKEAELNRIEAEETLFYFIFERYPERIKRDAGAQEFYGSFGYMNSEAIEDIADEIRNYYPAYYYEVHKRYAETNGKLYSHPLYEEADKAIKKIRKTPEYKELFSSYQKDGMEQWNLLTSE